MQHIILTWDEFEAKYKPQVNHILGETNAPMNGWMYETFEEEYEYVMSVHEKEPGRVWTVLSGDEYLIGFASGWHWVNRIGYIITEVPVEDGLQVGVYDEDDRIVEEDEDS
jgi:hypothetical protein